MLCEQSLRRAKVVTRRLCHSAGSSELRWATVDHIWERRGDLTGLNVRVTYQKSRVYQDFENGRATGYNADILTRKGRRWHLLMISKRLFSEGTGNLMVKSMCGCSSWLMEECDGE